MPSAQLPHLSIWHVARIRFDAECVRRSRVDRMVKRPLARLMAQVRKKSLEQPSEPSIAEEVRAGCVDRKFTMRVLLRLFLSTHSSLYTRRGASQEWSIPLLPLSWLGPLFTTVPAAV